MSNQATKHPATTRANRGSLDREAAARLLRDARGNDADDAVEWAYLTIPECLGARRLKIRMLLRQGNLEAADALIAQGLLQQPTNASLSYLRARSLFAQGKLESAGRELRLVLAKRPRHRGALELAGRVARGLGDARRAVALLERAERRRPDDQIRSLLVEAWLDGGRPNMARKVLRRMAAPTALLRAGVFRAAGRLLEARELLEQAAADPTAADHTEIMTELIDLLEGTSDLQRLRRVLEPVDIDRPAVLARAGMAWLAMGAFHTAAGRRGHDQPDASGRPGARAPAPNRRADRPRDGRPGVGPGTAGPAAAGSVQCPQGRHGSAHGASSTAAPGRLGRLCRGAGVGEIAVETAASPFPAAPGGVPAGLGPGRRRGRRLAGALFRRGNPPGGLIKAPNSPDPAAALDAGGGP
jgi:tetratricopeptide (TPR) repeat protein